MALNYVTCASGGLRQNLNFLQWEVRDTNLKIYLLNLMFFVVCMTRKRKAQPTSPDQSMMSWVRSYLTCILVHLKYALKIKIKDCCKLLIKKWQSERNELCYIYKQAVCFLGSCIPSGKYWSSRHGFDIN